MKYHEKHRMKYLDQKEKHPISCETLGPKHPGIC